MEAFLFIVICVLWFVSGAVSFIYWWTKEFDFTWDEFPLIIIGGVCGPVSFVVGWWVHGDSPFNNTGSVLFKKRG